MNATAPPNMEHHYRAVFDAVGDAIHVVDQNLNILLINRTCLSWINHAESECEVIGRPLREVFPFLNERIFAEYRHVFQTGAPLMTSERTDVNGKIHFTETHKLPLIDPGHGMRIATIMRDTTDRHLTEQRLSEQEQKLAQVARLSSLGELAAGLSHELSQPLCAVSTYAEACLRMVRTGGHMDDIEEGLSAMASQAERASLIIDRVRRFVRKNSGNFTPTDLCALVNEAIELVRHLIKHHHIYIQRNLPSSPVTATIDPVQVQQVLVNLFTNAIEAMEANDSGDRVLEANLQYVGPHSVEITVTDSGSSAAPEHLEHIFEPFWTSKKGGLGLGLSISRSITERHHGRLWAEINVDRGMRFHLRLPVSESVVS